MSVPNRFMLEAFEFVPEMQHSELEIQDHRIIGLAMRQRFGDLVFERSLPPFKISNMVWFCHDSPRTCA